MTYSFSTRYFYTLAVAATILLWGIALINGTVWALLKTAYQRQLPDGSPFQASYTGLRFFDFPIALLVGFFNYGTNGHDHAYQVFLLNAYATLQPAYVWLYVEAARSGASLPLTKSPVFFGLLWQALGGAVSLPLFYVQHLGCALERKALPAKTINQIRSIPLGFLLGAVAPVIVGMYPTWTGPNTRDARTHQYILAAWQLDPIWVSWIQYATFSLCDRFILPRYSDDHTVSSIAKLSYLLAATMSAVSHYHMIWQVVSSSNAGMSWTRMFFPRGVHGPSDTADILVRGPWLFLQYDFLIIALSSLSWAFVLLYRADPQFNVALLSGGMVAGTLSVGAGATVSLALFWREKVVQDAHHRYVEETAHSIDRKA